MKNLQALFEKAEVKSKLADIAKMTAITQQREVDVWTQKMEKY